MTLGAEVYGTSTVKKRTRYTNSQLAELDAAIYEVCQAERPLTVRGCFYRVMSRGLVEKSEAGVRRVQQRVLDMRRRGNLPYEWISDGTRSCIQSPTYSSVGDALKQHGVLLPACALGRPGLPRSTLG